MKEIRDILRFWEARRGQSLALATLVAAHGSSYRRPGARLLIDAAGNSAGGLSAGCIEEEVIARAQDVLRSGAPSLMTFDTRLRFGCQGAIDILVEPASEELLAHLHECAAQRRSCRLETVLEGNARGTRVAAFENVPGAFTQTIDPILRLVLIGDSADTGTLQTHASLLGWDVLQFEAGAVPVEMLDQRTAVVLATHNFGRDCSVLRDLLPAGLRYLGVVGSRRRRDDLLFDLMGSGVECQSSLFAPAGLHLGADSPEEIALSIVAEIQGVFGAGTAEQLRHRKAAIHQSPRAAGACAELAG